MQVYIKEYGYKVSTTDRSQDGVNPPQSFVVVDGKVTARFYGEDAPARAKEIASNVAAQRKHDEDRAYSSVFSLFKF